MSNIGYKLRCLKNINYDKMIGVINNIHDKTNKNRFYLLMDMINCSNKYGTGYYDYQEFEFYNLNREERKTYLTRVKNNAIVKLFNDKNKFYLFDNKYEFNKLFDKYLKRDWMFLNNNYDEFVKFCESKNEIIVKPVDGCGGVGVELIHVDKNKLKSIYNKLVKNKQLIVEEKIIQHKDMAELNDSSVNTLRIVTYYDGIDIHILNVVLKIGNGGVTDNFSSGSMYTFIKDGKIIVPAIDRDDNIFKVHPISHINLIGYHIPNFDKCIKLVNECAKVVPDVKYVGWDVAITKSGVSLIEGNCYPGIYQIKPSFVSKKCGLVPIYEDAMKIRIDKI